MADNKIVVEVHQADEDILLEKLTVENEQPLIKDNNDVNKENKSKY